MSHTTWNHKALLLHARGGVAVRSSAGGRVYRSKQTTPDIVQLAQSAHAPSHARELELCLLQWKEAERHSAAPPYRMQRHADPRLRLTQPLPQPLPPAQTFPATRTLSPAQEAVRSIGLAGLLMLFLGISVLSVAMTSPHPITRGVGLALCWLGLSVFSFAQYAANARGQQASLGPVVAGYASVAFFFLAVTSLITGITS